MQAHGLPWLAAHGGLQAHQARRGQTISACSARRARRLSRRVVDYLSLSALGHPDAASASGPATRASQVVLESLPPHLYGRTSRLSHHLRLPLRGTEPRDPGTLPGVPFKAGDEPHPRGPRALWYGLKLGHLWDTQLVAAGESARPAQLKPGGRIGSVPPPPPPESARRRRCGARLVLGVSGTCSSAGSGRLGAHISAAEILRALCHNCRMPRHKLRRHAG